MTKFENEKDIRAEFKNFDQGVLIGVDDVRQLIGAKNAESVYAALYRKDLPEPLIRRNRQLRWSVGQMRCYFQSIEDDFRKRQAAAGDVDAPTSQENIKKKIGKPRNAAEINVGGGGAA